MSTISARKSEDSIAIVGIGCRFPGAPNPRAFWEMMCNGTDAITKVPADRYDVDAVYDPRPATPGKVMSRFGGFLDHVDQFDASFFGLSPREASRMDPQHRLLLEVAWEAIEDAGLVVDRLSSEVAGVFIGVITGDYWDRQFHNPADLDVYSTAGSARSGAAGRISYALGLKGVSVAVDAACSSSLVAVHLACQSLRTGSCSMALAGGVNIILNPDHTIGFSQGRMMAADGHCKTFDARADGYVRSEGAGVVVLKSLTRALADGDPIYAVIRGSSSNNDGHCDLFMAPSVEGQKAGLVLAYQDAGIDPRRVQYVEAHGTGTLAGDPVEINALGGVLCAGRTREHTLLVGSVKTNIGHTEGAAGLAGLIKVALSLKYGMIPPNLHFHEPSPRIPWDEYALSIPTSLQHWPECEGPRLAGVSSFGIAGTNAHVVVEEAPRQSGVRREAEPGAMHLFPLSARSPEALKELAASYLRHLEDEHHFDQELRDLCYSTSLRRARFEHRLALVGRSREDVCAGLRTYLRGETSSHVAYGRKSEQARRIAWIFPGQGSQWLGMGRELLVSEPVFRAAIEECDAAIYKHTDWSLLQELQADEAHSHLNDINVVQPTLFAIEVALAALWRSWGIKPDVVVGHSMGEVAAAYVAGVLSLEDAAWIICARSRLLLNVSGKGAMAVVELSTAQAEALIRDYQGRVSVAVNNSPHSTVISGEPEALNEILVLLEQNGIFGRLVRVDIASHSPQMDPLHDDLLALMERIQPRQVRVPMLSTVTNSYADGRELMAEYWVKNLREPVLFLDATRTLSDEGIDIFMEMSPHPVLVGALRQTLQEDGRIGVTLGSLRREEDESSALFNTLGVLFTAGLEPDWRVLLQGNERYVQLPTYPWQRQRHWNVSLERAHALASPSRLLQHADGLEAHAMLGLSTQSALHPSTHFWTTSVDTRLFSYLSEHCVYDVPVLPGASYVELALAAASEVFGTHHFVVSDLELTKTLFFPPGGATQTLQLIMTPEPDIEHMTLRFFSAPLGQEKQSGAWIQHASVRIQRIGEALKPEQIAHPVFAEVADSWELALEASAYYAGLRARGIQHGPLFQGITHVWRRAGEVVARLTIPDDVASNMHGYQVHPALMDAFWQGITPFLPEENDDSYVPVGVRRVKYHQKPMPGATLWTHALVNPQTSDAPGILEGDLFLLDEDGQVMLEVLGLRLQSLESGTHDMLRQRLNQLLYAVDWERQDLGEIASPSPTRRKWLLLSEPRGLGPWLAEQLRTSGDTVVNVMPGLAYSRLAERDFVLHPGSPQDFQQLLSELASIGDASESWGVVYLWGMATTFTSESTTRTLSDNLELVGVGALHMFQAVAALKSEPAPRVWLVTNGVQSIEEHDRTLALSQAQLWGLGRVAVYEYQDLHCSLIDLETAPTTRGIEALAREIRADNIADEVALRGDRRYVARLAHQVLPEEEVLGQQPLFREDGTYLLTGGLGGVGLRTAQWMVDEGARSIVLLGRRGASPEAQQAIDVMCSTGVDVRVMQADVACEEQLASVLAEIRQKMPPLRGIFHSAVVLDDGTLSQLDRERFLSVMPPKVDGAWNLHRLTLTDSLDYFVLFSSAASLIGSPGQGNYAAANAFMDMLAFYRQQQEYPALCINWGRWGEVGQAMKGDRGERLDARGFASMKPKDGLAILGSLLRQSPTQIGVMSFNLPSWSQFYPNLKDSSLFARLFAEVEIHEESEARAFRLTRDMLAEMDIDERPSALSRYLGDQIARVLGHTSLSLEADQPLNRLGIDSLMAVELKNRIVADLGVTIPVSTFLQSVPFKYLITSVDEQL
ncbi:type I polyketide synthase [Ktedonospora formicarum]|uniref:Polyketide synthase n=1 Tax=Ktedonospora formicarum TaxID=2778364 RepID=A0A8J3MSX6_9CHLR|nr:type I polyketide synthase [Ktedonospora formicarum]GHO46585.1 polyketide synthase [Ktedonospora formicarum]